VFPHCGIDVWSINRYIYLYDSSIAELSVMAVR